MAINQFVPFATGGGAYVLTNAQYQALAARSTGFPAGLLPKENLNAAIRQGAFVAAALSQWTSTESGLDVLDDGNIGNWVAAFQAAFGAQLTANFIPYAGNPNGNVAGVQGNPGATPKVFPTVVWDTTNNIWWVCTTTGTATDAVWTESGAVAAWPFWCGTSTGTANAQTLSTPATMLAMSAGTAVAWQVGAGLTNTGAVTVTVGSFGTFPLVKDGPAGPIALTGGELVASNIVTARLGSSGTNLHLIDTALGTAALANASSNTGTVAAVTGAGSIAVGNLAVFGDSSGTVRDGGPVPISGLPQLVSSSQAVNPGIYYVDTSAGAVTLTLSATLAGVYTFVDAENSWGLNSLTVAGDGHNIGNNSTNVAATFLANVSDYQFSIEAVATYWRLV